MTCRERVRNAVNRRPVDRIPRDLWITREAEARLRRHFDVSDRRTLLDRLGIDIMYLDGPIYRGPPLRKFSDGSSEDLWGVRRRTCRTGTEERSQSYEEVVASPLAAAQTAEEIADYSAWPNPDDFDYEPVYHQCRQAGDRAVFFMGDRLNRIAQFKPAQYLRGMEQVLIDAVLTPDLFQTLIDRIRDFYLVYLRRILEAASGGIDVVVTGDDFGAQTGLLISRDLWRKTLYPGFKAFVDLCHGFNVPVMHHTCGSIYRILPDLVESGLDVLNPLQPNTAEMDHRRIKAEFGKALSFHGGIGIQKSLPFGTPQDVRDEVRRVFADLGPTGYIACTAHNLQGDVPLENALALFDAYEQFGRL